MREYASRHSVALWRASTIGCMAALWLASCQLHPQTVEFPDLAECVPDCDGKNCGDDGCDGSCGVCVTGEECKDGICVRPPDCEGKNCGPDGSDGSCGVCGGFETCGKTGQCECSFQDCEDKCCPKDEQCTPAGCCSPDCLDKQCGDDGCNASCGECEEGRECNDGQCEWKTPCGPIHYAGCCDGQTLKFCQANQFVVEHSCEHNRHCGWNVLQDSYTCGTDGGEDPSTEFPKTCPDGCDSQCDGMKCGHDECGGTCGQCDSGETCDNGNCVLSALSCPDGWGSTMDYPHNGKATCYAVFPSEETPGYKSWSQAETTCTELGGHLVSILSKAENEHVRSLLMQAHIGSIIEGDAWIGLSDVETETEWTWSDGSLEDFANWDSGEPDDSVGTNNCALMISKDKMKWAAAKCDLLLAYVCKIPAK